MQPAHPFLSLRPEGPESLRQARGWLWLATLAVAAAALFAILLVLARVPAIGALFPGRTFYRVALTQHVVLSQLVWFSTFAGLLWTLASGSCAAAWNRLALAACGIGALAVASVPALGPVEPMMSNYLPVLDSPVFLGGLALFGVGLLVQGVRGASLWPADGIFRDPIRLGLALAGGITVLAIALLPWSAGQLADLSGQTYFEALFWGSGHVWQFALTTLMMIAWSQLAGTGRAASRPGLLSVLLMLGALPLCVALFIQFQYPVLSSAYRQGFTDLMRFASWEAPLLLGLLLLAGQQDGPGGRWGASVFRLSFGLFGAGLLIGATISSQTTLVTAHYHGTIGAVTLAFMGFTYALLPLLGLAKVAGRRIAVQAGLYGWGNLLMMLGLAGAGWMGAPRKEAGNVALEAGFEMASRIAMGIGGSLALAGILMFFVVVARALRTAPATAASHPAVAAR